MPAIRSNAELAALRAEAERRVRAGDSRAEVSRALDLACSTVSRWAMLGRWRQIDIEAEQGGEPARKADALIRRLRAQQAAEKDAATRAALEEAARALEAANTRADEAEAGKARALETAWAAEARLWERLEREAAPEGAHDDERDAEEVEPMQLARASMVKAQRLMRADRLADAERAARMASRFLGAVDRIELREERINARDQERRRIVVEAEDEAGKEEQRAVMRQKLDDLLVRLREDAIAAGRQPFEGD